MIGIVGNMSGGKSYSAVLDILNRVREGHVIVTNIELNLEACGDYLGIDPVQLRPFVWRIVDDDVEDLGDYQVRASDYDSWPCGSPRGSPTYERDLVYIYLDEVSSIFDAMTSGAAESIKSVAAWARHTEKRGQILYLIMQFENELHKRLRVHITEYIYCKNMSRVTIPVLRCHLPRALFNFIAQIHLMPDGETSLGSPGIVPLDKRVFACYKTAQIVVGSQSSFRPPEADISLDFQEAAETRNLFLFVFFVCLAVSIWGFYAASRF